MNTPDNIQTLFVQEIYTPENIRKIEARIRRILGKEGADRVCDFVQETFTRAWGALKKIRMACKPLTWLSRIATNLVYDWLRKQRVRKNETSLEALEEKGVFTQDGARSKNPFASLYSAEVLRIVDSALLACPSRYRKIIQLRYWDGLRHKEIADLMGTTEGNIRRVHCQAIKHVRQSMRLVQAQAMG